ncbi:PilZ domain-containing protein [Micavibrio aeruginosavorus]|uniref:PilZ domain-containing protein n=1 Tax=Micavibrio aeruginosavorus EPB TaxID=349215 RepID=M4VZF7_9BACT|nr:PilZ domain-containing protein [Micavibrio aeruginosavorus]AGH98559.1 hypothetical protein A11S_1757 [Micavibrio aeruginosavorus EPB]
MLNILLAGLRANGSNDAAETRRRYPRRHVDRCVASVNGSIFPIENWSFGGLQIMADERLFGIGQSVDMVLKFKLRNTIVDIDVRGTVIRKTADHVGVEFEPLSHTIRRAFQQVIDDHVAAEFANSQI